MTEAVQAELISVGTGSKITEEDLLFLARKVRHLERVFCVREGMTRETDSLPKKYMDMLLLAPNAPSLIFKTRQNPSVNETVKCPNCA